MGSAGLPAQRGPWNWNIHHHQVVIDAIPPGATSAIDIGCGDGLLTFDLADRGLSATGIDLDQPSIDRARSNPRASDDTQFVVADVFDDQFEPESVDVVASISMLHHVDATTGLRRMRDLVRPGGVVAIVGFARPSSVADFGRVIAGQSYARIMKMRGRYWEHSAPMCWPPPCTMKEMRAIVATELPGAHFRPLMPSRYAAIWSRRS